MKYLSVIMIALILSSFISGCKPAETNVELIEVDRQLTGESAHWRVVNDIKGFVKFYEKNGRLIIESEGDEVRILEYKGNLSELKAQRNIKVDYPTGGFNRNTSDAPDSLIFSTTGRSLDAGTIIDVSKGKSYEVTVTWDGDNGDTETITVE